MWVSVWITNRHCNPGTARAAGRVVGEITHIAEANGPICDDDVVPNEPVYSDEQLVAELRRVGDLQAVGALTSGDFASRSTVSVDTLRRRFGGWRQALAAAGLEHRYSGRRVTPKMRGPGSASLTDAEIIDELRRIAAETGRGWITKPDVHRSTRIGLRTVLSRFGSWPAAVEAAGLRLSPMAATWTTRDLLDNLQLLADHLGRLPTAAEVRKPLSRISYDTYVARFGSWKAAKQAFVMAHTDPPTHTPSP